MIVREPYFLRATQFVDFDQVDRLETAAIGANPSRLRMLHDWFHANPAGFSVVENLHHEVVGCVNLVALRSGTVKRLSTGLLMEGDIRGPDLYRPDERSLVRDIYCESIVVPTVGGIRDLEAVSLILRELESLLQKIGDVPRMGELYALAATKPGKRFMFKLGFELAVTGVDRHDGRDLLVGAVPGVLERASRFVKRD